MPVLDFILNAACLLLWLNWRSRGLTNVPNVPSIAIVGTLRPAQRRAADRWPSSIVLIVVLLARAFIYWQIGPSTRWTPTVSLGPISLHFRSDMFMPMFLFSALSFLVFLAAFYFSLLLISGVNSQMPKNDPWHALVSVHLGFFSRLPCWLKLLAPFLFTFLFWLAAGPIFGVLQLIAPARSFRQLAGQAGVIGISGWLIWPYVIAVVLLLHVISSYVYFGKASFWKFIAATSRNLLKPLASLPLRVGKVDLTPLLVLALLSLVVIFAPGWLVRLYSRFGG